MEDITVYRPHLKAFMVGIRCPLYMSNPEERSKMTVKKERGREGSLVSDNLKHSNT